MLHMTILKFASLCALTIICYLPGLSGGFLFDDFANLDALGKYGGVNTLSDLWAYISKGISGPGGRPLSLLSFLINANQWPTDPWPFKVTNLLLHLTVALMLYWLIFRLLLLYWGAKKSRQALNTAWLSSAVWALHPLFVSTTLYVVQRMSILAALFVIIGLLTYVHGRSLLSNRPRAAYLWMTFGLGISTTLALLSKENGALLPLFVLIVEYTILQHHKCLLPKLSKTWEVLFLWIPVSSITLYLIIYWPEIAQAYEIRRFNLAERLLTESKIITEYLYHLAIPKIQTKGLFNDNYPIITSITSPQALISISLSILLLLSAITLRKRNPFFTLGIIFFYAGHILESTAIPLELYYEHRNYLPAVMLFTPIAMVVQKLINKDKRLFYVASISITLLFTFLTTARSNLWGDTETQMLIWAEYNPTSQRAQRAAAIELYNRGDRIQAIKLLEQASKNIPTSVPIRIHLHTYKCLESSIDPKSYKRWLNELESLQYNFRAYKLVEKYISLITTNKCKGIGEKEGHLFLDILSRKAEQNKTPTARRHISHLRGVLFASEDKPNQSLESFRQSLRILPDVESGLLGTAILASHSHTAQALILLEYTEDILNYFGENHLKRTKDTYNKEIKILREKLLQDIKSNNLN